MLVIFFCYRGKLVHTYSVERGWSGANEQAQCNGKKYCSAQQSAY
jgi:hypothetical protein